MEKHLELLDDVRRAKRRETQRQRGEDRERPGDLFEEVTHRPETSAARGHAPDRCGCYRCRTALQEEEVTASPEKEGDTDE